MHEVRNAKDPIPFFFYCNSIFSSTHVVSKKEEEVNWKVLIINKPLGYIVCTKQRRPKEIGRKIRRAKKKQLKEKRRRNNFTSVKPHE